jgi:glycosyltransferase involved in cell wall biosynthesis
VTRRAFHGTKLGREKLAFLQGADVFVLPSRNESFGIANLEAMATGLPVISTRTGAIPEYLQTEVHGLLVEPGDAMALAGAMRRLMDDGELRLRLGDAARQRAREYDWNVVAASVAAVYAAMLEPSATGSTLAR